MTRSPENINTDQFTPDRQTETELRTYEATILAELAAELTRDDHLRQAGVKIVCFTSLSKGGGKKRHPREVILVKYGEATHQFYRDRYPAYRGADSHAEEIFPDHSDNGHDAYNLYFNAVLNAISRR